MTCFFTNETESYKYYPDEISAREEIERYIEHYHHHRPHQALMNFTPALMNFTPAHVHETNNKSQLMAELKEMKRQTRERRKEFWMRRAEMALPLVSGGTQDMDQPRSVDPGANMTAVFQQQPSNSLGSRVP